jgi:F420-dependent oxidoreductase-like protein
MSRIPVLKEDLVITVGLQIPNFTYPGVAPDELFERVAAIASTADASGFDAVMVMDHFYQLPLIGPPELEMFEAYTLLGALAARTERVLLGTLVTGVTYRNPTLLAKSVTALDVISRGRAFLGIGAAWFETEHRGLGFDFPPLRARMEMLEEAVQVCRAMFHSERPTFSGRYYRTEDAINSPAPIRPGGPPIMIGGSGEQKTLRLVATYADLWNGNCAFADLPHKLEVLRDHCERVGRNINEINKTPLGSLVMADTMEAAVAKRDAWLAGRGIDWNTLPEHTQAMLTARLLLGDPDTVGERVRGLLDAGMDGVVFNMPADGWDLEAIAHAGEVLTKATR